MKRLLVVLRYDVEDFAINPDSGSVELYSRSHARYDQIHVFEQLSEMLDKHDAKSNFAVTYSLLKSGIGSLSPLLDSKLEHLYTWHMHLKWDAAIRKDWGKSLPSCYIGHYRGATLEKLLDLVEKSFKKAFGYSPKVNLNACFSSSEALLRSLERRGYLVQGDYTPNTDYRVMEKLLRYRFAGGRPFAGGPGAPCYPYVGEQPYHPNGEAGMLSGDMNILVVPMAQLSPGMGLPHQDTYQDPNFEIRMIQEFIRRTRNLDNAVIVLPMHVHPLLFGEASLEENVNKNLSSLDKVLSFLETVKGMEYASYLDVRDAYIECEKTGRCVPFVRDTGNGYLAQSKTDSMKYQTVGHGEAFFYDDPAFGKTSLAIAQQNGIAEWLADNEVLLGPLTPQKTSNKTFRRKALMTTDVFLNGKKLAVPNLNLKASKTTERGQIRFEGNCVVDGLRVRTKHVFDYQQRTLKSRSSVQHKGNEKTNLIHCYHINPLFKIVQKEKHSVALSRSGVEVRIEGYVGMLSVRKTRDCWNVRLAFSLREEACSLMRVTSGESS